MKTEVTFWTRCRNDSPILNYIKRQDEKIKIKLLEILEDINQLGFFTVQKEKNYIKPVNDLFEIKHKHCRILFQKLPNEIYLLHAFDKDSQKIKIKHIKLAQKRKI